MTAPSPHSSFRLRRQAWREALCQQEAAQARIWPGRSEADRRAARRRHMRSLMALERLRRRVQP